MELIINETGEVKKLEIFIGRIEYASDFINVNHNADFVYDEDAQMYKVDAIVYEKWAFRIHSKIAARQEIAELTKDLTVNQHNYLKRIIGDALLAADEVDIYDGILELNLVKEFLDTLEDYRENLQNNGMTLARVPDWLIDANMCKLALDQNPQALEFVPERFKAPNRDYIQEQQGGGLKIGL